MPIQIFVEDELMDAYEILALRALGLPTRPRNRSRVQASRINIEDLTSLDSLLRLTQRAKRAGSDCILFIMDREGPRSPDRREKLAMFRQAFQGLCNHLTTLREGDPLYGVKVSRIVCLTCLEGWLATDLQAVVDSIRGRRGVNYHPSSQGTENLFPHQASERIAHTIRETGRHLGRQDLHRVSASSIKSRGGSIAEHVSPERARQNNRSLDYFYQMIQGDCNGCDHPFPDGPIEP